MKRNPGIYLLTAVILLPLLWLIITSEGSFSGRGIVVIFGGIFTAGILLSFVWQGHMRGKILPHKCSTCGRGLVRVKPGTLRPPAGTQPETHPRWRCMHCGRLI